MMSRLLQGNPSPRDQANGSLAVDSDADNTTLPPDDSNRTRERHAMVEQQILGARDGRRAVENCSVLKAMRSVHRHAFMPHSMQEHAYLDQPLPIGEGQTISQPYIVAVMTNLMDIKPGDRVLEIGTGSGYQAAVLAELTDHVHSIELRPPLANKARQALESLGYQSIRLRTGDGYHGWPDAAPFNSIILTCASDEIPPLLWKQLRPGGRIVMPLGPRHGMQRLTVSTTREDGSHETETISAVRFVPLLH